MQCGLEPLETVVTQWMGERFDSSHVTDLSLPLITSSVCAGGVDGDVGDGASWYFVSTVHQTNSF